MRRLGVSRVTLRRALREMVDRNLLVASPQRGWFVAATSRIMSEPPNALQSFTETGESLGLRATAQVLVGRDPRGCDRGGRATASRSGRGHPVSRAPAPSRRPTGGSAPGAGSGGSRSVTPGRRFRDSVGLSVSSRPRAASPPAAIATCGPDSTVRDARLLGAVPLLVVRQITFDQRGEPIELSEMRYRGDRYHLQTSLHRRGPSSASSVFSPDRPV